MNLRAASKGSSRFPRSEPQASGEDHQTRARHSVVSFALLAMAVAYVDRVCISTAAPSIKADLALTDAQLGWVFSGFTFAYALFEMPSGWLANRFGARAMLARIVLW